MHGSSELPLRATCLTPCRCRSTVARDHLIQVILVPILIPGFPLSRIAIIVLPMIKLLPSGYFYSQETCTLATVQQLISESDNSTLETLQVLKLIQSRSILHTASRSVTPRVIESSQQAIASHATTNHLLMKRKIDCYE